MKFLIILTALSFFQSCQSQETENPVSLGKEIFKLENVSFKENVDILFSKIPFAVLNKTKDRSKSWIYRNKIDSENKVSPIISFYKINGSRLNVITNESKEIQAFSTYIETTENPKALIEEVDQKISSYKVNLKPNKKLEFSKAKLYQWNLPDKIYAVTISNLDNKYTVTILVAKAGIDKNTLSVDLSPICLDNTCKE